MANKTYTPSTDSDYLNPAFLFTCTETELLVAVANGSLNAQELAQKQLAARGLDATGKWVGFKKQ